MHTARTFRIATLAATILASALPALLPGRALAQAAWPTRPVKLIVPYPAGGNADAIGRALGERLSPALGQQVVIENRAGAGATIGAQAVAQAVPDGYTFLIAPTAVMAITPHLRKVPYDPAGFTPVAKISGSYGIVTARKDLPARTMSELSALARSLPGKLAYGSAGLATITHLSGEIMQQQTGIKLLHVPYKGSIEAMNDLLGGRIDLIFDSVALPQIKAGNLRALAVMSDGRHPELPDVPTLREQGIGFENRSWFGLFAPKGTPADVVTRLASAIEKVLAAPDFNPMLLKFSQFVSYDPPATFADKVRDDSAFFKAMIEREGIKVE